MLDRISPIAAVWIILAASIATLLGAYIFEYGFGYLPCHLCLIERIPYMVAIVATLAILVITRGTNFGFIPVALLALCALAFAIGAGISLYHTGVEYKWWAGPSSCSGSGMATSFEELQAQLNSNIRAPRCDEPAWTLFGISLAGANFLISLALLGVSSLPLIRLVKDTHGVK